MPGHKVIELHWSSEVPDSEFDPVFAQRMADAMQVSFFKYGKVADALDPLAERRIDALACSRARVREYQKTGNVRFLVDAANFLMMEFMVPSHEAPCDIADNVSPGRVQSTGQVSEIANEDL